MMDKEDKKPDSKVEEKRIKPAVIRRRKAVVSPETTEEPKVVVRPEVRVKVKEEAEEVRPRAAAAEGAPAPAKKTVKPRGKVSKKEIKEKLPHEAVFPPKAAPEEKEEVKIKEKEKEAEPVKHPLREVKIFKKEEKSEKLFYTKQLYRKGRLYEIRDARKKPKAIQPSRALKKTEITVPSAEKKAIKIVDAISIGDFSQRLGVKANEIIRKLMGLGIMATVNQLMDFDSASLIAHDYGYEVENVAMQEEMLFEEEGAVGELTQRPPVVTVMGHVDHGKTSLLDAIRKTNVASGEAGGITQHIGAYHVHLEKGDITFLDTPGHAAFTAMRARGAKVTDIVILVVAADDGVMPQTVEAINHAKAAAVPMMVVINKIDLPQADTGRVKKALTEYGLLSEEWGGETIFVEVSAKKGIKIKELLEMILLQAEMLELKANSQVMAKGVIIEAKLDKGRGPVATVLVQNGTLRVGDACIAGVYSGRIRAMISDWGKRIEEAGPSLPVEVLGFSGVPQAGDAFMVVKDEATAKQIASLRGRKFQEKEKTKLAKVSLADLYERIKKGEVKELNVIIKADAQGSIEAVKEALGKIISEKVELKIIHGATGGINEGDVMLAAASNAIIIGFNARAEANAQEVAHREGVDIRFYNIIYNLVDDVRLAMTGLLEPIVKEVTTGRAEVRDVFKISKVGNIAGSYVTDGKIARTNRVRLIRDNVVIHDGRILALKRFKDDVKEVQTGFECGISIEGYNDIKAGDVIEAYELKEEAAKL